jgi:hypothetical protein
VGAVLMLWAAVLFIEGLAVAPMVVLQQASDRHAFSQMLKSGEFDGSLVSCGQRLKSLPRAWLTDRVERRRVKRQEAARRKAEAKLDTSSPSIDPRLIWIGLLLLFNVARFLMK